MSLFYYLTTSGLKVYFHLFYRFSIYGNDKPYKGKALLAANHASFLDPPIIGASWPEELHFLARASLFDSKPWNWLLTRLNAHPLQGTAQDIESFRLICKLLSQGKKVVIFPEGERSATGELQKMKAGIAMLALKMECPIIPVYLSGTYEAWPRHKKWPVLGKTIACVFGEPIYPSVSPHLNKKQIQEKTMQQVQEGLEKLRLWLENKNRNSK